jgi:hypothetical protein
MSNITYKVVRHDGGLAYEANGTYSEPFPTREAARKAAKPAASEQLRRERQRRSPTRTRKGAGTPRSTAVPIAPERSRRLSGGLSQLTSGAQRSGDSWHQRRFGYSP